VEPPIGIEPMTYALRGARDLAAHALAAPIAPIIALTALAALGLSGYPVHEPVHARGRDSLPRLLPVAIIEDSPCLRLSGAPFHEPFYAGSQAPPAARRGRSSRR
jgi:hypothetical protein